MSYAEPEAESTSRRLMSGEGGEEVQCPAPTQPSPAIGIGIGFETETATTPTQSSPATKMFIFLGFETETETNPDLPVEEWSRINSLKRVEFFARACPCGRIRPFTSAADHHRCREQRPRNAGRCGA